jgi:hypothetical protein
MESLFTFLSNLVLFLTVTTLVFAIGAYLALVLRRRAPLGKRRQPNLHAEAALLRRYLPRESE